MTSFSRFILACACSLFISQFTFAAGAPANFQQNYTQVSQDIIQKGDKLADEYNKDNAETTADGFLDLYLSGYEGTGMENTVAAIAQPHNLKTEQLFRDVTGLVFKQAPPEQVQQKWQQTRDQLKIDALIIEQHIENGATSALVGSFTIVMREGLEAMLVIFALLIIFKKRELTKHNKVIYIGASIGLLLSLIFAAILLSYFSHAGQFREAQEGISMFIAAAMLFYVSCWMLGNQNWKQELEGKVSQAISKGSLAAIGFTAFISVFREGAETALFLNALANMTQEGVLMIVAGIGLAAIGLLIVYFIMSRAAARLPFGPFFKISSLVLYIMAFSCVGQGIAELQEGGLIAISPISWLPSINLYGLFQLSPSVEAISAQAAFVVITGLILLYLTQRQSKRQ
ncbi:FTR1 family protein [uncultured Shewanella sp.]|uniref:FTR1 family iron permease n=1 Tax=uncultured Shewanella sp. TaxID=173975 RepID=UPI0026151A40|nr:FTR1 family protein [uncultured Shewanella sp.]